jgi:hypothetical protein
MRILDIRVKTVSISRYADPGIPSGDLDTTVVAIVTDVRRNRALVVGFGFSSIGRFGLRDALQPIQGFPSGTIWMNELADKDVRFIQYGLPPARYG